MQEKSLGRCKILTLPYELAPECRCCLEVFANWEELATHLKKKAKHKMRFRYKKWNELYPFDGQYSARNCPTCAKAYASIGFLDGHMDKMDHHRYAIVSRYVCDNAAYEKRAKQKYDNEAEKVEIGRG